ncbi:hypothetical protein BCR36DRAFT_580244 [Piromyces finnis]|uniref:Extracellular membrane protein CFEM domain-containing protein n=1 Tax=Piromyces finnis TaxID=1754191 RepID=A0A1Y1VKN5_9FUNG|nr:hypothetical protein BCR36DRAFT_580244 [Piromyces finnis]|eukprot:ORX58644.1 hypothetical protein BCR36DRAFT_580244 [Piromyces finnis]
MRISSAVVALLAATSAYANIDFAKFLKDASGNCKSDVGKYTDCLIKPTAGDYKERCSIINSEECENFFSNADKLLSTCIGSESVTSIIAPEKISELQKDYTKACKKFKEEAEAKKTTTTKTKTKTTTKVESKTEAKTSTTAATSAETTNASAANPVANDAAAANNGTLNNVVAGNSTAENNQTNVNQSSDATKVTVSLLLTVALVMLSF